MAKKKRPGTKKLIVISDKLSVTEASVEAAFGNKEQWKHLGGRLELSEDMFEESRVSWHTALHTLVALISIKVVTTLCSTHLLF